MIVLYGLRVWVAYWLGQRRGWRRVWENMTNVSCIANLRAAGSSSAVAADPSSVSPAMTFSSPSSSSTSIRELSPSRRLAMRTLILPAETPFGSVGLRLGPAIPRVSIPATRRRTAVERPYSSNEEMLISAIIIHSRSSTCSPSTKEVFVW